MGRRRRSPNVRLIVTTEHPSDNGFMKGGQSGQLQKKGGASQKSEKNDIRTKKDSLKGLSQKLCGSDTQKRTIRKTQVKKGGSGGKDFT